MNRLKIAQYIALAASVCNVLGFLLDNKGIGKSISLGVGVMTCGLLATVVAYCFGGLLTALKMIWKVGKIGWVFVFPLNIFTGCVTMLLAAVVLVCLPIIPVRMAYKEQEAY
jgi:hypothetical protein